MLKFSMVSSKIRVWSGYNIRSYMRQERRVTSHRDAIGGNLKSWPTPGPRIMSQDMVLVFFSLFFLIFYKKTPILGFAYRAVMLERWSGEISQKTYTFPGLPRDGTSDLPDISDVLRAIVCRIISSMNSRSNMIVQTGTSLWNRWPWKYAFVYPILNNAKGGERASKKSVSYRLAGESV